MARRSYRGRGGFAYSPDYTASGRFTLTGAAEGSYIIVESIDVVEPENNSDKDEWGNFRKAEECVVITIRNESIVVNAKKLMDIVTRVCGVDLEDAYCYRGGHSDDF